MCITLRCELEDMQREMNRCRETLKFIATDKIANAADMRYRAARAMESLPRTPM